MADEILIDKGGRLTLPPAVAKLLGDRTMRLASCSEYHLLLEGADAELRFTEPSIEAVAESRLTLTPP